METAPNATQPTQIAAADPPESIDTKTTAGNVSSSTAINYAALRQPIHVPKIWLGLGFLGTTMVLIVFALPAITGGIDNRAVNNILLSMFIAGFFVFAPVGFIVYVIKYLRAKAARYERFLQDNGWIAAHDFDFQHVATSLLGIGSQQIVTECFKGRYNNLDMHAAVYRYTTGSGKSQETHTYTNLSLELTKTFPLIVIDDKHNNGLFSSSLPERIKGGKTLELEGDFNDRFRVTVLPDTERDVLQVLTPDFMEELLQTTARTDIELEANKLFLITKDDDLDEANLTNLFSMADVVLKNLNELSDTWQASSSAETVAAMAEKALSPRLQIKPNARKIALGTIIMFIIYVIIAMSGSGQ